MPKIAELMELPDGRLGVALNMPDTDEGELTIWTGPERDRAIRSAVLAEREACAELMDEMVGGVYAEAIRNRAD
jgi:hypothetical protein